MAQVAALPAKLNAAIEASAFAEHARLRAKGERDRLHRYADHDGNCPAVAPVPRAALDALPDDDARMAYLQTLITGCTCGFDDAINAQEPEA